ncbi:hypothetical protein [Kribbella sp. NBC_00889]|uniref:hypothetical protein n=1 Tax=Kribbella sp. NBC_00889 TaxID=2975974 RepID=UPI003868DAC6|nr:hypothetical protein OG817_08210 [Kribbella sp. NBC_00889]
MPRDIRADFLRVGLTAAAVWAVAAGLFLSIIPSYAGKLVLHTHNMALLALITSIMLGSSCVTQLLIRHGAPPRQAQAGGLLLLAIGLLTLVLAAQDDLTRIAPAETRAEVSAAFYVCIYLGVALPVIGIGVLAVTTTLFIAVATFAAVTGGASRLVAGWHLTRN